jgi:TolB-like protein
VKGFVAELQRRRVFRVAAVYAGVAFIVAQVAALLLPALLLPEWVFRLIVVLLILGFPLALALAWAFDVTPFGVVRTSSEPFELGSAPERPPRRPASAQRIAAVGGVVMFAAAAGAFAVFGGSWQTVRAEATLEDLHSIAVLPLENRSADEENEYFSDGLTEELLNALAQVEGLRVAARTSSFAFKGVHGQVGEIGRSLNVRSVLEGSVRREGNRVRVTVQLSDVATGHQLWSRSYDRELSDIFAIQDAIAREIVASLVPRVASAEALARLGSTSSVEAYEAYLKARHAFWEGQSEENLRRAARHYEEALAHDPDYALALAGLSDAYMLLANHLPPREVMPVGRAAAVRALELDRELSEGYVALASINWFYDWDWEAAARNYRRSFSVNRAVYTRCICYVWYLAVTGDVESAVQEAERARALDPVAHLPAVTMAWMYYLAGQPARAEAELAGLERTGSTTSLIPRLRAWMLWDAGNRTGALAAFETQLLPGEPPERFAARASPVAVAELAYVYSRAGRTGEARRIAAALEARAGAAYVPPEYVAAAHGAAGDTAAAALWLERAYENRSNVGMFSAYPVARSLHGMPAYARLLERIGMPNAQAAARGRR